MEPITAKDNVDASRPPPIIETKIGRIKLTNGAHNNTSVAIPLAPPTPKEHVQPTSNRNLRARGFDDRSSTLMNKNYDTRESSKSSQRSHRDDLRDEKIHRISHSSSPVRVDKDIGRSYTRSR